MLRHRTLGMEQLENRRCMAASPQAVQLVYELNLARNNPAEYASLHPLANGIKGISSTQPLAIDSRLTQSALQHASEMSLHDYLAHQSILDARWPNRMVRDAQYPLPGEFLPDGNSVEVFAGARDLKSPGQVLESWLSNSNAAAVGNRQLLLGSSLPYSMFTQVGVGYINDAAKSIADVWTLHAATQGASEKFLTGVVYEDRNGNQRYDAGEGLEGVAITAEPFTTVSEPAGNWSLQVAGGLHEVVASGGPFTKPVRARAAVTDKNVEVDFLLNEFPQVQFQSQSEWTNPFRNVDVNQDGKLTPLDALLVINVLNSSGSYVLPEIGGGGSPPPYFDVSGDHKLTPLDALLVINALNASVPK